MYLLKSLFKSLRIGLKLNLSFAIIITSMLFVIFISLNTISSTLINQESKNTYEMIKQTQINLKVVLTEIEKLSLSLSRDDEITNLVTNLDKEQDQLVAASIINDIAKSIDRNLLTQTDIVNISIVTNSGQIVTSGNHTFEIKQPSVFEYPVMKKFIESKANALWIDTYEETVPTIKANSENGHVITLVRKMYSPTSLNNSVGTIIFYINESAINNVLKELQLSSGGKYMLVGSNRNIVFDPQNRDQDGNNIDTGLIPNEIYNRIQEERNNYFTGKINGTEHLVTYVTIDDIKGIPLKWSLVSYTEIKSIVSTISAVKKQIWFYSIIALLLGALLSFGISRDLVYSIKNLLMLWTRQNKGGLM